jgi:hypothetical protein
MSGLNPCLIKSSSERYQLPLLYDGDINIKKLEINLFYSARVGTFLHVEMSLCRTGIQKHCGSMNPLATKNQTAHSLKHVPISILLVAWQDIQ